MKIKLSKVYNQIKKDFKTIGEKNRKERYEQSKLKINKPIEKIKEDNVWKHKSIYFKGVKKNA